VAAYFFKNFYEKEKQRIKGIIELGAAPIRIYKTIEAGLSASVSLSREFIEENVDIIFEKFNEFREKWKT
jgi:hypothetical protein